MKLKTPNTFLLLLAIVIYIAGIFQDEHTFDFHLHDTYFVINGGLILPLLAIIPLFFWLIYVITWKYLFSKTLSFIHTLLTIFSILLLVSLFFFSGNYDYPVSGKPVRYYDYSNWNNYKIPLIGKLFISAIMLLIIAQCMYLFNLIKGLSRLSQIKVSSVSRVENPHIH